MGMKKRQYRKIIKKYARNEGECDLMLEMANHGIYGKIMSTKSKKPLIPYLPLEYLPPSKEKWIRFYRYHDIGQGA